MMKVKICGITNEDDAIFAQKSGADLIGIVFAESPRKVSIEKANDIISSLSEDTAIVALFSNADKAVVDNTLKSLKRFDMVQFHGDETPQYCLSFKPKKIIKAIRVRDIGSLDIIKSFNSIDYILLDAYVKDQYGGTGNTFNWDLALKAKNFNKPIFLSGGLNPENIRDAVKEVSPFAVDVSSGVEESPGKKDNRLVEDFIKKAKTPALEDRR